MSENQLPGTFLNPPEVDITGFEYKRSDIAPVTKEVQKRVIEMIVTGEDREDVRSYVRTVIEDFQSGKYTYDEIGIPGGIGQRLEEYDTKTAHVRGAKYSNVILGTNFGKGSKPKRLYLERVRPEFFDQFEQDNRGLSNYEDYREFKRNPDVICFEYDDQIPEEFEVNYEKMLEKTLKGPISRILEGLGISWDEVRDEQPQSGLGQYM
jgi:DNA polymerase elongation subunit (family B)